MAGSAPPPVVKDANGLRDSRTKREARICFAIVIAPRSLLRVPMPAFGKKGVCSLAKTQQLRKKNNNS